MAENDNYKLTGFGLLKDMSREEMIDELLEVQRIRIQSLTDDNLRANIIDQRVSSYKNRLCEEAGLTATPFGYAKEDDEDD